MALKDWEKQRDIKKLITWTNQKERGLLVELYQHRHTKKWIFVFMVVNTPIIRKSFKTKTLALKFAKNYMRKH